MIKATLLALGLSAALVTNANAADNTVTVTAQSKLMERGQMVSDHATVGLGLRFNDVFVPGTFVRANVDSVSDLAPVNGTINFRSDVGMGFTGNLSGTDWELSVNRVMNQTIYDADYTEARMRLNRGVLFAEVGQGLTNDVNRNTYIAAGLQKTYGKATVGGLVSTVRYSTPNTALRNEFNFNNAEVFARYNVWKNVDLNVNYSHGGKDRHGVDIKNQVWGGVTARF